jgi:hypothetical protein
MRIDLKASLRAQGRKRSGNQTKTNESRRARKKPIIKLLKKPPPNSSIEPLLGV